MPRQDSRLLIYSEKDFWNKHPELAGIDKVSNFVKQYSHFKLAFADYVLHLDTYKQVIFFDCDLIVLNDISHIKTLKSGISFRYGFYESYKEQRIPGPNGGLISFASDLPFKKISKIFSDSSLLGRIQLMQMKELLLESVLTLV